MPTTDTFYVNTDSTTGGDGTTNATTGANRAFADLAEAEASFSAGDKDLVTEDKIIEFHISTPTTDDSSYTDFGTDWVTDATRYIVVKAASGQEAGSAWSSGQATFVSDAGAGSIKFQTNSWRLEGLQFEASNTPSGGIEYPVNVVTTGFDAGEIYIEKCIARHTGTMYGYATIGFFKSSNRSTHYISNCIFYDFAATFDRANAISIQYNPDAYVYHNTFVNCDEAIDDAGNKCRAKNNLFQSNDLNDYDSAAHADSGYNVTDQSTFPVGSNNQVSKTVTFGGADDYSTSDTDAQVSDNLYSDTDYPITDDIDGNARPSSGSVYAGAYEDPGGGSSTGTGSGDLPSLEGSGSGDSVSDISGSGSGDLPSLEGSGSGTVTAPSITGTGSGDLPSLEGSGAGDSVSTITGTGSGEFPSVTGSGEDGANPFSGNTGERMVFPFLHTETIAERLTAQSWSTWDDWINAGYPYLAQPTPTTATFEEVIDLGAELAGSIISVVYNKVTLDGSVSDACTISYSSDGVSYTDVSGFSVYGIDFRYVKVNIVFTGADDSALAYIDGGIEIRIFTKNETDEGIVSAVSTDSGGTSVTFNKTFLDISSLVVSVDGNTALTAVPDFDDVPDPTGFEVYVYDKDGVRQSATVRWIARGSIDPGA